jgi:uncharacterized 2Fe-2S/4Fe-4S cluster protein (DUF4445 family)
MLPKRHVALTFEPDGLKSEVERGTRILDAMKTAGLAIRSECGGKGICGKCKIIAKDPSKLTKITEAEKDLIRSELRSSYRLACECSVTDDVIIYIPEESRIITRKLLIEGTERPVEVDPAIRKVLIRIPKSSLQDIRSDAQRLRDTLNEVYGIKAVEIDHQLLKKLPEILRDSNWKVTAAIRDEREIVSVEKGDTSEDAYGISVDVGTSKIVIYLSNLLDGQLIATESVENPQIKHGEDIISRISYAKSESQLKELQQLIITSLNKMVSEACRRLGLNPQHIYEAIVVGNTAMHHFFLGIQPKHLGLSPYVPAVASPINEKARNLGLRLNDSANVHVFPVIAAFVGGDAVADIISTGIYESDELSMVLDIGTNTEVVIGNKDRLMACSCASGPAFEGAHIKCGMKAVTGAIERLQIESGKLLITYQTIGDAKPIGLCGSAIVDVVASLLKWKVIDGSGTFASSRPTSRIKTLGKEKSFVLVSKKEGASRDIAITQKDIREVQLAKAAIYTGCYMLMKRKHAGPEDVKNLYVAGAFGNYLNLENSKLIGMLPDIPTKSMSFVGNAAGAGARMALISKKLRQTAAFISRKVDYVELALEEDFQREFGSAMFFPHRDLARFPSLKNSL